MPVNTIDTIEPKNGGNFPVVRDTDVQGGIQVQPTTVARDAIPLNNQKVGMLVYVTANSTYYQLTVAGTPGTWVAANLGATTALAGDVTGTSGSNSVTKIRGVVVSTNSVANDGYALVSTGGVYVPTGVQPVMNVKNFGAKGDGTTDDRAALVAADSAAALAIGQASEVVLPPGTYKIGSNYTTTAGTWRFLPGSSVVPSGGVTLTFGSEVVAPKAANIFGSTQTAGGIAWVSPTVQPDVWGDWWGATSSGFALQRAFDSVAASGIPVLLRAATYTIGSAISSAVGLAITNSNAALIGQSRSANGSGVNPYLQKTILNYVGTGPTAMTVGSNVGSGTAFILNNRLENFMITTPSGVSSAQAITALRLWYPNALRMRGVVIQGPKSDGTITFPATAGKLPGPFNGHSGICCYVQNGLDVTIEECYFDGNGGQAASTQAGYYQSAIGLWVGSAAGQGSGIVHIVRSYIQHCYIGAYVETSTGIAFSRCVWQSCLRAVQTAFTSSATLDSECWIEGCGADTIGAIGTTGTSPPAISVTGTPAGAYSPGIEIDITNATGPIFTWKLNGITQATGVNGSTPQVLGSTGLTVTFPSATYNTNNVYVWLTGPTDPNSSPAGAPFESAGYAGAASQLVFASCFVQMYNLFCTSVFQCEAGGKLVARAPRVSFLSTLFGQLVLFPGFVENPANSYISIYDPRLFESVIGSWLVIPASKSAVTGDTALDYRTCKFPSLRTRLYRYILKNTGGVLTNQPMLREDGATTSGSTYYSMPEYGYVLGVDVFNLPNTGVGNLQVKVGKNGGYTGDNLVLDTTLTSDPSTINVARNPLNAASFTPGLNLGCVLTTDGSFPGSGQDIIAEVTVGFVRDFAQ